MDIPHVTAIVQNHFRVQNYFIYCQLSKLIESRAIKPSHQSSRRHFCVWRYGAEYTPVQAILLASRHTTPTQSASAVRYARTEIINTAFYTSYNRESLRWLGHYGSYCNDTSAQLL